MKRSNDFQAIRSEGGLLPPDLLRRVLDRTEKLPGTLPEDYGLPTPPHGLRPATAAARRPAVPPVRKLKQGGVGTHLRFFPVDEKISLTLS